MWAGIWTRLASSCRSRLCVQNYRILKKQLVVTPPPPPTAQNVLRQFCEFLKILYVGGPSENPGSAPGNRSRFVSKINTMRSKPDVNKPEVGPRRGGEGRDGRRILQHGAESKTTSHQGRRPKQEKSSKSLNWEKVKNNL